MATLLAREQDVHATASGLLLRPATAAQKGDVTGAIATLSAAARIADEGDVLLHAAAARYRLGHLLGGDEGGTLLGQASEWMKSQCIKSPERMINLVAPGFPR